MEPNLYSRRRFQEIAQNERRFGIADSLRSGPLGFRTCVPCNTAPAKYMVVEMSDFEPFNGSILGARMGHERTLLASFAHPEEHIRS